MLNTKAHERMLAYTARIGKILPIEGADNIELVSVLGWKCIAKKGEFHEGDMCVYFEIDSKVPAADWSAFLEKRNYRIKTMKLGKFGVISQGLALPVDVFDVKIPAEEYADCTKLLGVTYYVAEDNARKSAKGDPNAKYISMKARHPRLFKTKWAKWMMKREWGRRIMFALFGKKKDKPRGFPSFVAKTDEDRIENQPWRLEDSDKQWVVSEKLDGTSSTYALVREPFGRFEFYVCSRNVRQQDEKQVCYHDHNIYWDMAFKYDIEKHLRQYLNDNPDTKWVCIQGESVGSVQGNPLKLAADDLYVFNFITDITGRWSSIKGRDLIESWGMKWVPLLGVTKLPQTMEEMKALATGQSVVNPAVMREGLVYRSLDGDDSFKNVSIEYLLRHNG